MEGLVRRGAQEEVRGRGFVREALAGKATARHASVCSCVWQPPLVSPVVASLTLDSHATRSAAAHTHGRVVAACRNEVRHQEYLERQAARAQRDQVVKPVKFEHEVRVGLRRAWLGRAGRDLWCLHSKSGLLFQQLWPGPGCTSSWHQPLVLRVIAATQHAARIHTV